MNYRSIYVQHRNVAIKNPPSGADLSIDSLASSAVRLSGVLVVVLCRRSECVVAAPKGQSRLGRRSGGADRHHRLGQDGASRRALPTALHAHRRHDKRARRATCVVVSLVLVLADDVVVAESLLTFGTQPFVVSSFANASALTDQLSVATIESATH